jgi:hypothetical protein
MFMDFSLQYNENIMKICKSVKRFPFDLEIIPSIYKFMCNFNVYCMENLIMNYSRSGTWNIPLCHGEFNVSNTTRKEFMGWEFFWDSAYGGGALKVMLIYFRHTYIILNLNKDTYILHRLRIPYTMKFVVPPSDNMSHFVDAPHATHHLINANSFSVKS